MVDFLEGGYLKTRRGRKRTGGGEQLKQNDALKKGVYSNGKVLGQVKTCGGSQRGGCQGGRPDVFRNTAGKKKTGPPPPQTKTQNQKKKPPREKQNSPHESDCRRGLQVDSESQGDWGAGQKKLASPDG